jgi:hypothetical protein
LPDGFHEGQIECFIIVIKVNPSSKSANNCPPLTRVSHHNAPALLVVLFYADLLEVFFGFDAEFFVNLVFDWETMAIPSESPFYMMAFKACVSADDVLGRLKHK